MPGVSDIRPVLDVISLKVKEGEKSIEFYVDCLGLDLLVEENDIAYLGSKITGDPLIALYEFAEGVTSGQRKNALARFSLRVPRGSDYQQIKERLTKQGYSFQEGQSLSGHDFIRVADPEGHMIDLLNLTDQSAGFQEAVSRTDEGTIGPAFIQAPSGKAKEGLSIHGVRLSVRDVVVSHRFYTEVLGFGEKLDEKGLKLTVGEGVMDYLRLANTVQEIATDDAFFGLDYLAFKVSDKEDLEKYAQRLVAKEQAFYYNKRQGLLQIDDPDGNHLWFYH